MALINVWRVQTGWWLNHGLLCRPICPPHSSFVYVENQKWGVRLKPMKVAVVRADKIQRRTRPCCRGKKRTNLGCHSCNGSWRYAFATPSCSISLINGGNSTWWDGLPVRFLCQAVFGCKTETTAVLEPVSHWWETTFLKPGPTISPHSSTMVMFLYETAQTGTVYTGHKELEPQNVLLEISQDQNQGSRIRNLADVKGKFLVNVFTCGSQLRSDWSRCCLRKNGVSRVRYRTAAPHNQR